LGLAGVHRYLSKNLPAEENIECRFGQPIVSGDRAAIRTEQRSKSMSPRWSAANSPKRRLANAARNNMAR
jgi:hypothetical protein